MLLHPPDRPGFVRLPGFCCLTRFAVCLNTASPTHRPIKACWVIKLPPRRASLAPSFWATSRLVFHERTACGPVPICFAGAPRERAPCTFWNEHHTHTTFFGRQVSCIAPEPAHGSRRLHRQHLDPQRPRHRHPRPGVPVCAPVLDRTKRARLRRLPWPASGTRAGLSHLPHSRRDATPLIATSRGPDQDGLPSRTGTASP